MIRLVKFVVMGLGVILLSLLLSACAMMITSAEGGPSEPVVEEVAAPQEGDGALRPIEVSHVQIEVGVGSPIPVDAVISGTWPGLCAQLAQVSLTQGAFSFAYEVLATPEEEDCPPDMLGLPFLLRLPINTVELPEGTYTVTVNGVSGTFEMPLPQPAGP